MKRIFTLLIFTLLHTTVFADGYPDTVEIPITALELSKKQLLQAAREGLNAYKWAVVEETESSLTGDLNGRGRSKVGINITDDKMTISYLTKEDLSEYKYYRRLLSIKAATYKNLLDCTNRIYMLNPPATDRSYYLRAAVFAVTSYKWVINKQTDSEIISSLPTNGRMEALITDNGATFRHWNEFREDYIDGGDSYTRRVEKVYQTQLQLCPIK